MFKKLLSFLLFVGVGYGAIVNGNQSFLGWADFSASPYVKLPTQSSDPSGSCPTNGAQITSLASLSNFICKDGVWSSITATVTGEGAANGIATLDGSALLTATQIPNIPLTKVGNDDVTATQLSYLNTTTSNIQTQLNSKQASLGFTAENSANKGIASGYAGLDSSSLILETNIPAAIPAIKIGNGDVTNAELSFINSVTSNVQTQLNGKAASTVTSALTTTNVIPLVSSSGILGNSAISDNGTTISFSEPLLITGASVTLGSSGPAWTKGSGAPSGSCIDGSFYSRTDTTGGLYYCQSSGWVASGTGSGGGATIASTSAILKGDGAGNGIAATAGTDYIGGVGSLTTTHAIPVVVSSGTLGNSSISDNATLVTITEPLLVTGSSVTLGSSGPTWTQGSGAPSGACTDGSFYSRTDSTGGLYFCASSAWSASGTSSGGTGTVTHTGNLTAGDIVIGNGTADEKVTGIAVDSSNNISNIGTIANAGTITDTLPNSTIAVTDNNITITGKGPGFGLANTNTGGHTWSIFEDVGSIALFDSTSNNTPWVFYNAAGHPAIETPSGGYYCWTNNTTYADQGSLDTCIQRAAAGNLTITNGYTGSAALLTVANTIKTVNSLTYASSLTVNLATGGLQTITLTGNVTSSTFTNIVKGETYQIQICQNGTGGFTFAWPATILHGGMTIGTMASTCSVESFTSFDGTNLYASTPGVINQ